MRITAATITAKRGPQSSSQDDERTTQHTNISTTQQPQLQRCGVHPYTNTAHSHSKHAQGYMYSYTLLPRVQRLLGEGEVDSIVPPSQR